MDGRASGAAGVPEEHEIERRTILITDAMTNRGNRSDHWLVRRAAADAAEGLHLSILGVGIDFQSAFTKGLNQVRGANF